MFKIRLPRFYPVFSWIQIEVTTKCNASCLYCPHYLCRSNWINREVSLKIMEFIEPALPTTDLVYLQGWGEPLLYPDLWKMIDFLKKRGVRVGLTSNGTLITREIARRLVETEVDIIAFSLAGTDKTNDLIRKGTTIDAVKKAAELINEEKEKIGAKVPCVHLAYLLLKSNLNQLKGLPDLLNLEFFQEVVISPLTFPLTPELDDEVCFKEDLSQENTLFLKNLRNGNINKKTSARIDVHLVTRENESSCSEKIDWSMTIGSDGKIYSCVFTMLPVRNKIFYYYHGQKYILLKNDFGVFYDQSLKDIWYNKKYRNFRKRHLKCDFDGLQCRACYKRSIFTI
ncbi:radical SAM/SPASM domain-containing protein [Desulfovulcanus sp.]